MERWYSFKDLADRLSKDDAKELVDFLRLNVCHESVTWKGLEFDLLDAAMLPSYLAHQYDPVGEALESEKQIAELRERQALFRDDIWPYSKDADGTVLKGAPWLHDWLRYIKVALRNGVTPKRKLNTVITIRPGEDMPQLSRVTERMKELFNWTLHKDKFFTKKVIARFLRSDFAQGICLDDKLDIGDDIPVRASSYFEFSSTVAEGTFGRIRVFCPPDVESTWFCRPLSDSFKMMEHFRPFGRYKAFWDTMHDKGRCTLSSHDWHLFTSSMYRGVLDKARMYLIETARERDTEIYTMVSPSLQTQWSGTLSEYIDTALQKVIYACLIDRSNDNVECIKGGTTLGLQGGWQLSSILHAAAIEYVHDINLVPKCDVDYIICGDDCVISTPLDGYEHGLAHILGVSLTQSKTTIDSDHVEWLKAMHVHLGSRWYRAPFISYKSISMPHCDIRLACSKIRSCSDNLASKNDNAVLAYYPDCLENCWDVLTFNLRRDYDVPPYVTIPDGDKPILIPRFVFGRYVSTDPSWIYTAILEGHIEPTPQYRMMHIPLSIDELLCDKELISLLSYEGYKDAYVRGMTRCCWLTSNKSTMPPLVSNLVERCSMYTEERVDLTSESLEKDRTRRFITKALDIYVESAVLCFPLLKAKVKYIHSTTGVKDHFEISNKVFGFCGRCVACEVFFQHERFRVRHVRYDVAIRQSDRSLPEVFKNAIMFMT